MRYYFVTLLLFVFFVSCGSSSKKYNVYNNNPKKYITVVNDFDGYCAAYTDDGHTMIYTNDSVCNNIVYYAKNENNTGEDGLRFIDEKIVRVEIDSSLTTLKSILSFSGGAFCEMKDMGYNVYYFDEQMKGALKEDMEVHDYYEISEDTSEEYKINKIIALLNVACEIAHAISDTNVRGWNNIFMALEPIQNISNHDIIISNTVYDPRTEKCILRMLCMAEALTEQSYSLYENRLVKK